jgi:hypothetical protein
MQSAIVRIEEINAFFFMMLSPFSLRLAYG